MSEFLTYTYDGTLEGFLCCVFDCYERHELPNEIVPAERLQCRLEQRVYEVATVEEKWQRVHTGVSRQLGGLCWTKVRACFTAGVEGKELLLLRYLARGFAHGRRALDDLAHRDVLPLENLYQDVGREVLRMQQFARFAKLDVGGANGAADAESVGEGSSSGSGSVYSATINPKHAVLPLIMDHFAARFNVQQFVIYDEVHGQVAFSEAGGWYLVDANEMQTGELASTLSSVNSDDREYQRLWKAFYDAITLPERRNEKLRRQFMPKRLWKHLTEMQPGL